MMGVSLQEKAMLATLHIRAWTARKHDKTASEDVARRHASTPDPSKIGRYNKILVAREAINRIERIVKKARSFHYEQSLPWLNTGARILPAANFTDYSKGIRKLKAEFEKEVEGFLAAYPDLLAEARDRLGDLFKEEDYPASVRDKFSFHVSISPLPTAGDFRVALAEDEVARIKTEIEERNRKALIAATRDLRERLLAVVEHMATRLEKDRKDGKPPIFRDSLVTNILEMAEAITRMNIADDPALEELARRVKEKLQYDPEDLRSNVLLRRQAATRARNLATEISQNLKRSDKGGQEAEVEEIISKMNPFYLMTAG